MENTEEIKRISEPYIEQLKAEQNNDDTEYAHSAADNILCKLLTELGYGDVVKEYSKIEKWYA